jgi:energy-coupling factor transport system permease protein
MMLAPDLSDAQLDSPLGRTSPVLKLGIAVAFLVALAFTLDPLPPVVLTIVVLLAGLRIGHVPERSLVRALVPLWSAALGIALFNILFSTSNGDVTAREIAMIGPFRITAEAVGAGVAIGLRVLAIASVGAVFALTTDSTRLVDALVQQARAPERFAYGALAAYQAIPRFAEDLTTIRQARRIRGLRGGWHPRVLVTLLVLAIRHGDRKALAMDARAFGSGPRSAYRVVSWGPLDVAVGLGAIALLAAMQWVPG